VHALLPSARHRSRSVRDEAEDSVNESDDLLCHCRMNPDGHEPGSVLDCEAPKITNTAPVGAFDQRHHVSQMYRDVAWSGTVLEIETELAKAASTKDDRRRRRDHIRMMREAYAAVRSRPEPCINCSPLRCHGHQRANEGAA
jgi:hypothetical protein